MLHFWVYKDTANYWRWRLYAANNRILADSGEGYFNLMDCYAAVDLVKGTTAYTPVRTATP